MCLSLDYFDLTHTDKLIASPETYVTNDDKEIQPPKPQLGAQ